MLPTEKECRQLAEKALSLTTAEDASIALGFGRSSNTRFANNEVTTSGAGDSGNVFLSVTNEQRAGTDAVKETSEVALREAYKRAEALAALLPANPEYVGPLEPQKYLTINAYDEATANLAAAERVPGVRAVIEPAAKDGMNSSGFYINGASVS